MEKIIKKFIFLLTAQERKKALLLLVMVIIMALLDTIGVASIMPFVAVLTNPTLIETNFFLITMFNISGTFGVETYQQFLFALGILVFLLLLISITFKAVTIYFQTLFITNLQHNNERRLVEGYIHQPYSWFLNRHSADLGKNILSEVSVVIANGFNPLIELISKSLICLALISLLLLTNVKLTIVVSLTLGLSYLLIYLFLRKLLSQIGKERIKANKLRFTAISEIFGAIKEIKAGGLEKIFINQFSKPSRDFALYQAYSKIISQIPRYALEIIAFGGMLLAILYLMIKSSSFVNALPIIALYTFAGYRLMPAIQQIYQSITQLRFVGPAVDVLYNDKKSLERLNSINTYEVNDGVSFKKNIILNNINYNYPNSSQPALKDINIDIPVFSKIGIVGPTGSGKTTMVDIILSLLEAQKGTLVVDDKIIDKNNCRVWQNYIGYVPQNIFLIDDTVAANIAFGIEKKNINLEAVKRAAKIANLDEFVNNELPNKYHTTIGERGIRLSGGQRQRIGIARAMYHNPKLLILDEATNAVDNLTEKAIMEEVYNIDTNLTIIMIAHRLSTVMKCDKIFLLEKGKLIKQGTYGELKQFSDLFNDAPGKN